MQGRFAAGHEDHLGEKKDNKGEMHSQAHLLLRRHHNGRAERYFGRYLSFRLAEHRLAMRPAARISIPVEGTIYKHPGTHHLLPTAPLDPSSACATPSDSRRNEIGLVT